MLIVSKVGMLDMMWEKRIENEEESGKKRKVGQAYLNTPLLQPLSRDFNPRLEIGIRGSS
jgi:hypothetical protein